LAAHEVGLQEKCVYSMVKTYDLLCKELNSLYHNYFTICRRITSSRT